MVQKSISTVCCSVFTVHALSQFALKMLLSKTLPDATAEAGNLTDLNRKLFRECTLYLVITRYFSGRFVHCEINSKKECSVK